MTERESNGNIFDWSGSRGERWLANLDGFEGMLEPIIAPLIGALQLDRPYRIADIGCGGGPLTRAIAHTAPAGSVVDGYDISPALVEEASRRAANLANTTFAVADAASARPDELYDRLTSRLGVMFFQDGVAAFRNLSQWLRPGGRFAFAVWGEPSRNPWMSTLRNTLAAHVELARPEPDTPGPFRYGDRDFFAAVLTEAGFTDVELHAWEGDIAFGGGVSATDAAQFALASMSLSDQLVDASDDVRAAVLRDLTATLQQHEHDGVVRLGGMVWFATGVRA